MTAGPSIDPAQFLNEQLSQASPDLMRDLLSTFVNALLSAQADAVCGAGYGERTPERVNSCNGYRHRDLDTRDDSVPFATSKCLRDQHPELVSLEAFEAGHTLNWNSDHERWHVTTANWLGQRIGR